MEFYVDNVDNSVYNSVFLKKRGFRMWITFLKKIIFVCFFVRDFVALCILLNSSARPIAAWAELYKPTVKESPIPECRGMGEEVP